MKASSRIRHYIKARIEHLQPLLRKPSQKFSQRDFHTLRVEIKKLNALTSLGKTKKQQDKVEKYLKPFNTLFEQAGKVRESQLAITLTTPARKSKAIDQYLHMMTGDILQEKKSFFDLLTPQLKKKMKSGAKKMTKLFQHQTNQQIETILNEKSVEIREIMSHSPLKIKDVHDIRKKLKVVYYLRRLLAPDNKGQKATDTFQELLGKWHDGRVQVRHLQAYVKKHLLHARDKKSIQSLIDILSRQTHSLLAAIQKEKRTVLQQDRI